MKKKTKSCIAGAITLMAVAFLALNVLAYNHAWTMMHFTTVGDRTGRPETLGLRQKAKVLLTGVNIPRPAGHRSPSDLDPECRVLRINGSDAVTLEAWYCDQGERTPLVIQFHGYSAEKTSLIDEARAP